MRRLLLCAAALAVGACAAQGPQPSSHPPPASTQLPEVFTTGLARLNHYRTQCGLAALTVDPELDAAAASHAAYLMSNKIGGADVNISGGKVSVGVSPASLRSETPGMPGYSASAAALSQFAYIYRGDPMPSDGAPVVDFTMTYPTGAMIALNPRLERVGYGQACRGNACVAVTLLPISERSAGTRTTYVPEIDPRSHNVGVPERLKVPIEFPPPDSSIAISAYRGDAPTDPLTACPGYVAPTGPVIILALGHATNRTQQVEVTAHSVREDGKEVESCAFDADSYRNPDPTREQVMLGWLKSLGAVVIIPREPLRPGHRYTVSLSADSDQYRWSFSVAPAAK